MHIMLLILLFFLCGCQVQHHPELQPHTSSYAAYSEESMLVGTALTMEEYHQQGNLYRNIYNILIPYLVTHHHHQLEYPTDESSRQNNLLYFSLIAAQTDPMLLSKPLEHYLDQNSGVYTIPKSELDALLARCLEKPELNEAYLVQEGYLSEDRSVYTIKIEGFGLAGNFMISNVKVEDTLLNIELDVDYDMDGNPDQMIKFSLASNEDGRFRIVSAQSAKK